jgi:hypothetical protein
MALPWGSTYNRLPKDDTNLVRDHAPGNVIQVVKLGAY